MTVLTATKPASTQEQFTSESRVLLTGVSWQTFKALLAEIGEDRNCRIAYDRGTLEIMTPYAGHEEPVALIEHFITAVADQLGIEVRQLGSLTLERSDLTRMVEPDTCFYIQNESLVRGKAEIDLNIDPPPDLVVESDHTNSSLNKFEIYASLGVPELWRYRRSTLQVDRLVAGKYEPSECSLAFPFLPITEVPEFIAQSKTIGQRSAVRAFRQRIQAILGED
ncbi:MAG: Uma2 family endonuclease [Hormoscilla sp.]